METCARAPTTLRALAAAVEQNFGVNNTNPRTFLVLGGYLWLGQHKLMLRKLSTRAIPLAPRRQPGWKSQEDASKEKNLAAAGIGSSSHCVLFLFLGAFISQH
jgi:hypothetical protein